MSTCILTDNTAVFSAATLTGHKHLRIFPIPVQNGEIVLPTPADFIGAFNQLEKICNNIVVLTISHSLLPIYEIARQAAIQHGGMTQITVIDSQQAAAGQGLLAQVGAQAAASGASLTEVEEHIRSHIPQVYTLVTSEAEGKAIGPVEGESGLMSVYSFEEGQLSVFKRVRTKRHLLESFQEFIEEFETPRQVSFVRGPETSMRSRPLREMTTNLFPGIPFNEQDLPVPLAALLGKQALAITIMENQ